MRFDRMNVTLKKFLEIVGENFIQTWIASLYIERYDVEFQEYEYILVIELIKNIKELDDYMDYEIISFQQKTLYGEIVEQKIYLRKQQK